MNRFTVRSLARRGAAPLALFATVFVVGCGGEGEAAPQGGPGGRVAPLTPVETAVVKSGSIARGVDVSGVVEPLRTVGVNSQISGAVLAISVEEGSLVRAGQVLARLDDRELSAQVASAEANYNVTKAAFERAQLLRERQVITLAEFERDRAAFAAAEAQLSQLRTRHGFATVEAPVSGVVLEKRVEAGDVVPPNTRLFTLGETGTMVVRVAVSELDVVHLSPGDEANVAFDAFPGRRFVGHIRRVFPAADPTTRLVPVEVALGDEAASSARPGFLARVNFALGGGRSTLLVPAGAVVAGNGSPAVYVVEGGKALLRSVEQGAVSQGQVEILSGLNPGDAVVVVGNNALRDGAQVRVVSGPGAQGVPEPEPGQAVPRRGA